MSKKFFLIKKRKNTLDYSWVKDGDFDLEDFESRSDFNFGGDLFEETFFKYFEDFEDSIVQGELFDMSSEIPISFPPSYSS